MLATTMIFIAIGSNLPHPDYGDPFAVCGAAVVAVSRRGCRIAACSRWYRSSPVPASDQPDFVNGGISVETELGPAALLRELHRIEKEFGRNRSVPHAARVLDLDLIAYEDVVAEGEKPPILPHPRMSERAFVLFPIKDVAPEWVHPVSGMSVSRLVAALPKNQKCDPIHLDPEGQAV